MSFDRDRRAFWDGALALSQVASDHEVRAIDQSNPEASRQLLRIAIRYRKSAERLLELSLKRAT